MAPSRSEELVLFSRVLPKSTGHLRTCVPSLLVLNCTFSSRALGPDPWLVPSKAERTSLPPLGPEPFFLTWSGGNWAAAGRGWMPARKGKGKLSRVFPLAAGLAPMYGCQVRAGIHSKEACVWVEDMGGQGEVGWMGAWAGIRIQTAWN